jgi:hypothetical protein
MSENGLTSRSKPWLRLGLPRFLAGISSGLFSGVDKAKEKKKLKAEIDTEW